MPKSLNTKKENYKGFLSDVDFKFGIRMKLETENNKPPYPCIDEVSISNPLFYYNRIPVFKWRKKPVDIDGNNGPTNESYYNFLNDYVSKGVIDKIQQCISTAVMAKFVHSYSKVEKHIANVKLMRLEELAISNAAIECINALRNVIENDGDSTNKTVINKSTIAERVKEFVNRQIVSGEGILGKGEIVTDNTILLEERDVTLNKFSKYIEVNKNDLQGYSGSLLAITPDEVRSYCFVADMVDKESDGVITRLINYLVKYDFLSKVIYTGATFSKSGYNLTERRYEDTGSGILVVKSNRVSFKGSELKDFNTEVKRQDLPKFIECYIKVYMTINYILEDALSVMLGNTDVYAETKYYSAKNSDSGGRLLTLIDEAKTKVGEYTITLEPRFV